MDYFDIFADLLVLCIVGLWIAFAIAWVKKEKCGEILKVFSKKGSKAYIALGVLMVLISLLNLWTLRSFSINMKIMNWLVYPTGAIELFYFGISKIQFRENGVIWNAFVTKYADIKSYRWEGSDRVVIVRKKGFMRKLNLIVQEQNKEGIMRYLKEKVAMG